MIEAQVQSTANGAIVYDRSLGVVPDERWFDRAHWPAGGGSPNAGRGTAAFVDTPAGACVLRHYRRGGFVARLSADCYLWTGAARTRAFREFELLARLVDAGLPAPRPVAARYVRDGIGYRADLLTRRIADAQTLAERLAAGALSPRLAHDTGRTIAAFHEAQVWHADLNAHNVLVDGEGTVWLIDFDRGRLRKPARSWRLANLARLRRSFDKLGARGEPQFDARFWQPLLAAYDAAMSRSRPVSGSRGVLS
ncbi:3-deoxy-D-manno-octulosonic acid kinase [Dokdonella ginsengisoli]|uniref:3-deoxy-D-manno-octulosonic acid kinase n=1 Tax=Dokdonella ginsengisoli TaxID=363846 RepID=A0ABV9QX30_9GAMM